MKEITYLLGAGASYGIPIEEEPKFSLNNSFEVKRFGGMPLVRDIPERLNSLKKFIDTADYHTYQGLADKYGSFLNLKIDEFLQFRKDFIDLIDRITNTISLHISIDTLARKYYLTNKPEELKELKFIIDLLFQYEQLIEKNDQRYDLFFAAILEKQKKNIIFPPNVNIVTWNYDIQLESVLRTYFPEISTIDELRSKINCHVDFGNGIKGKSNFSITKINGTSNPFINFELSLFDRNDEFAYINFFFNTYSTYKMFKSGSYVSEIKYSWEGDPERIEYLKTIFSETDILVVIGYSFPTFNRKVDKELLTAFILNCSMYNKEGKKIYIQDKVEKYEEIKTRLIALIDWEKHPTNIHQIKDGFLSQGFISQVKSLDEFYIPFEY